VHRFKVRYRGIPLISAIKSGISVCVNGLGLGLTVIFLLACTLRVAFCEWRDPTQPGHIDRPSVTETAGSEGVVAPLESALKVTEIWISDSDRRAIIDGMSVRAGQHIDDNTQVLKIMPRHVIVKRRGETQTLPLVHSVKTR